MVGKSDRDGDGELASYLRYHEHLAAEFGGQKGLKLSIILPVGASPFFEFLVEALISVAAQSYANWELIIFTSGPEQPELASLLDSFSRRQNGRVKFVQSPHATSTCAAKNAALALVSGDFVTVFEPCDRLYPHALSELMRAISSSETAPDIIYSDSRPINDRGVPIGPVFHKPDWSPTLHLSFHYPGRLTVYRTSFLRARFGCGGFREDFAGAEDYDLLLRASEATSAPILHVPMCLIQERTTRPDAECERGIEARPPAVSPSLRALSEASDRRGRQADFSFDERTLHYRPRFALPASLPLISILIPSRNGFSLISRCLHSIFSTSTYANFEVVLLDHETDDKRCLELFAELEKRHGARFRRLPVKGHFNFARFNNFGVENARGKYVVLLNNDTEIVTPDWLEELLSFAQHPEAGAVGPKLLFSDRRVQNAGIYLYAHAIAGTAYENFSDSEDWYQNLLHTVRETCAVTGACLMIEKQKYQGAGGLDEVELSNGFGDVDFCLKLRSQGFISIYTPYAELYHHESKTRGRTVEVYERFYMLRRWGALLLSDPYLNPSLGRGCFLRPDFPSPLELSREAMLTFFMRDAWFSDHARRLPLAA